MQPPKAVNTSAAAVAAAATSAARGYTAIGDSHAVCPIAPTGNEIQWARNVFRDLLKIRSSSRLFRLRTADEIKQRLKFYNTGSAQVPTVLVGHLDGTGYRGSGFRDVLNFINADTVPQSLTIDEQKGKKYELHPVHRAFNAADKRPLNGAAYERATGRFTIPARSAVVFVVD